MYPTHINELNKYNLITTFYPLCVCGGSLVWVKNNSPHLPTNFYGQIHFSNFNYLKHQHPTDNYNQLIIKKVKVAADNCWKVQTFLKMRFHPVNNGCTKMKWVNRTSENYSWPQIWKGLLSNINISLNWMQTSVSDYDWETILKPLQIWY